jgi:hypothetical protein
MMDLRGLAARECARPEPAPMPGIVDVTAHLLAMMRASGVSPDVVADIEARAAFGRPGSRRMSRGCSTGTWWSCRGCGGWRDDLRAGCDVA